MILDWNLLGLDGIIGCNVCGCYSVTFLDYTRISDWYVIR